jgi:anti-sigma B factor antagonist
MRAGEELQIAIRQGSGRVIVELEGELDMASSRRLQEVLTDATFDGLHAVVLDLRGVSFLDSTGLKAIFILRNAVRGAGAEFAVTPGSAQVQRLLSLTRLDNHLHTIASPDAALA